MCVSCPAGGTGVFCWWRAGRGRGSLAGCALGGGAGGLADCVLGCGLALALRVASWVVAWWLLGCGVSRAGAGCGLSVLAVGWARRRGWAFGGAACALFRRPRLRIRLGRGGACARLGWCSGLGGLVRCALLRCCFVVAAMSLFGGSRFLVGRGVLGRRARWGARRGRPAPSTLRSGAFRVVTRGAGSGGSGVLSVARAASTVFCVGLASRRGGWGGARWRGVAPRSLFSACAGPQRGARMCAWVAGASCLCGTLGCALVAAVRWVVGGLRCGLGSGLLISLSPLASAPWLSRSLWRFGAGGGAGRRVVCAAVHYALTAFARVFARARAGVSCCLRRGVVGWAGGGRGGDSLSRRAWRRLRPGWVFGRLLRCLAACRPLAGLSGRSFRVDAYALVLAWLRRWVRASVGRCVSLSLPSRCGVARRAGLGGARLRGCGARGSPSSLCGAGVCLRRASASRHCRGAAGPRGSVRSVFLFRSVAWCRLRSLCRVSGASSLLLLCSGFRSGRPGSFVGGGALPRLLRAVRARRRGRARGAARWWVRFCCGSVVWGASGLRCAGPRDGSPWAVGVRGGCACVVSRGYAGVPRGLRRVGRVTRFARGAGGVWCRRGGGLGLVGLSARRGSGLGVFLARRSLPTRACLLWSRRAAASEVRSTIRAVLCWGCWLVSLRFWALVLRSAAAVSLGSTSGSVLGALSSLSVASRRCWGGGG